MKTQRAIRAEPGGDTAHCTPIREPYPQPLASVRVHRLPFAAQRVQPMLFELIHRVDEREPYALDRLVS